MLTENSKITFYKLHYNLQPDKHNLYMLARSGSKDALRVDGKIIEIVGLLSKGKIIKEAAKAAGYSVDVVNTIVKMLQKSNFIKTIDHERYDREKFTENSRIQFHKLKCSTFPDENDLYAIVRWDTDDSLLVDKKVIEVVDMLNAGKTVKQAAVAIGYSADVVMTILKMLEEAHFFKGIDDIRLTDCGEKITPWLTNVPRKWFKWVLWKPIALVIFSVSISGICFGIFINGLPSYKSFFWTPDIFIVFVSLFVVDFFLLLSHESAHFIVTKAVGGEAKMRINYRYIYVVAETESYHLALVPKKHRYLVYLAGSFVDIFITGVIYWILFAVVFFHWHIGVYYNFLIAIILYEFIGIIWQFDAFLETDMYNLLSDYLGIDNLRSDALKYIDIHTKNLNKIIFFPIKHMLMLFSKNDFKNTDDFRLLNKSGKTKIYIYMVVLILGIFFTTVEYAFYTVPRDITYLYRGMENLFLAIHRSNGIQFFKSLTVVSIVLFEYFLLLFLKIKEKK